MSAHDSFYQEAEKNFVGAVASVHQELRDFVTAMRHAAEKSSERDGWLAARANFRTLRATMDALMRAMDATEKAGDAEFRVEGDTPS